MLRLSKSLNAWGTPDFAGILKEEIEQLDAAQLPLQQGLSTGMRIPAKPVSRSDSWRHRFRSMPADGVGRVTHCR
jgi:hypothetical protein